MLNIIVDKFEPCRVAKRCVIINTALFVAGFMIPLSQIKWSENYFDMKIGYKVQTKSQALIRKAEMLLIKSYYYIASAEAKCGWSFNIVEMTNAAHD